MMNELEAKILRNLIREVKTTYVIQTLGLAKAMSDAEALLDVNHSMNLGD